MPDQHSSSAPSQPTLATTRLVLRPAAGTDLHELWTCWSDRDVRRFLFDGRAPSVEETTQVLGNALRLAPQGMGLWMLMLRWPQAEARQFVGCAGLLPVTLAARHEPRIAGLVEPMVALLPLHWHQGLANEALSALREHAFGTLRLARLAAVHDLPNHASGRMLRRQGFRSLSEVDGPYHRIRTYLLDAPSSE
jgi:[ribosomal protein S5]-alanine N-acetyltransferase